MISGKSLMNNVCSRRNYLGSRPLTEEQLIASGYLRANWEKLNIDEVNIPSYVERMGTNETRYVFYQNASE